MDGGQPLLEHYQNSSGAIGRGITFRCRRTLAG
jgi:hypothetical protein